MGLAHTFPVRPDDPGVGIEIREVAMTRILLIEDNELSMKLAVILINCAGYEALQARNAEVGIALAREQIPDLILMDLQLPDMDGLSVTRLLRQDPSTRNLKIVAMTACAMAGEREKAKEAGCDEYIDKPISIKKFIATIKEVLGK